MTTLRLVPFADLNLRARVDETGRIRGFIDDKGRAVLLAVADDTGQIGTAAGGETAFRSDVLPVNSVLPAISGDGTIGVALTASNGTWSGADKVYTYQWYLGTAAILNATTSSYTPLLAQLGSDLTIKVTATDPAGAATAQSTAVTVIVDVAPVNSVAPALTGDGTVGVAMTTGNGTWSGVTNVYTYQWKKDGVAISAATTSSYTPLVADIGGALTCLVTATNTGGTAATASNAVTAIDVAPVNSVAPVISGTGVHGSPLTTTNGTWTGSTNVYTYQWKKGGVDISAATANTYTPVVGDVASAITCSVTATNSGGVASHLSNAITIT